jgi:hypothetical protein
MNQSLRPKFIQEHSCRNVTAGISGKENKNGKTELLETATSGPQ